MANFNKLSAYEAERLALLSEELGEAVQAIGKILRHGYASTHPNGGPDNRGNLEKELGDVRHAVIRMCEAGDIKDENISNHADVKRLTVEQYLHYNQGPL